MRSILDMAGGFGGFLQSLSPELQKEAEAKRNLQRLGAIVSGAETPAYARPGGVEYSPDQFDQMKLQQLWSLGTPEAASIASQFIETPETRLKNEDIQSQIRDRAAMRAIQKDQLGIQREELALTKLDKDRNYRVALKELETKLSEGGVDPKEIFDRETKLRNEFVAQSNDFRVRRDAFDNIESLAKGEGGPNDVALMMGFMKLQDPTSVVSPGEQATVQNSPGVSNTIRVQYNKLLEGDRLTPEARNKFVEAARRTYDSAKRQHEKRADQYTDIAKRAGADPRQVIVDLEKVSQPELPSGSNAVILLDENFNVIE